MTSYIPAFGLHPRTYNLHPWALQDWRHFATWLRQEEEPGSQTTVEPEVRLYQYALLPLDWAQQQPGKSRPPSWKFRSLGKTSLKAVQGDLEVGRSMRLCFDYSVGARFEVCEKLLGAREAYLLRSGRKTFCDVYLEAVSTLVLQLEAEPVEPSAGNKDQEVRVRATRLSGALCLSRVFLGSMRLGEVLSALFESMDLSVPEQKQVKFVGPGTAAEPLRLGKQKALLTFARAAQASSTGTEVCAKRRKQAH